MPTKAIYSPASRKNVDRETDPYIARRSAASVAACPACRAICRNKRWYLDEIEYKRLRAGKDVVSRTCPACRKIADGFAAGVVTLRGDYLREHRGDILNLVRNEEKRARGINPLARIVHLKEGEDWLEVATTAEKLAQRIGREVYKACRGTLEYKWSEDAKLVRVNWARGA